MKWLLCTCACLFFCLARLDAQQVTFTPKWTAQAQFAGYYAADVMGFYREEGLDVRVLHPTVSESSFFFLETGKAQVVVMNLSQALTSWIAGTRMVNIMQTSQTNSLMLVSRFPIPDLASLDNRKIAVWRHLSPELLNNLAKMYHLNVEWIFFNSGVNLFLAKAVDICLVGSYNEYPQLEEYGMVMDSCYVLRLPDYGYDLPEDGVYVTEEFYNANKETVQKFVRASIKGWIWANEHREKALDIVMDLVRENNIGTNRYHQRKMLEEILRLQQAKGSTERPFKLSEEGFNLAVKYLIPDTLKSGFKYQDFVK